MSTHPKGILRALDSAGVSVTVHRPNSAVSRSSRIGVTRYLQLYTFLAQELADGRFSPKHALPSEPELVRQHGLSRTTVRRALERLEREGRIERRRGSGTYVRDRKETMPHSLNLQTFSDPQAQDTSARNLQSGLAAVPLSLQSRYPSLGTQTRTVKRLRSSNGEASQLESIYYCNVPGARNAKVETAKHELCAVAADSFAARHLRVTAGTPLLRLRTEFNTTGGGLVAVAENLFRCDRANLQVSIEPGQRNGRPRSKAR